MELAAAICEFRNLMCKSKYFILQQQLETADGGSKHPRLQLCQSAVREAHTSWHNRGPFEPLGTIVTSCSVDFRESSKPMDNLKQASKQERPLIELP